MKHFFFFYLLFLSSLAHANVEVGAYSGLNIAYGETGPVQGKGSAKLGISFGALLQYSIDETHGLIAELAYTQKGASAQLLGTTIEGDVQLDYLELPLLFKYEPVRWGNLRAVLLGGISFGLAVGRSVEVLDVINVGLTDRFGSFDFSTTIGAGIEYTEPDQYSVFAQTRFAIGWIDLDNTTDTYNSRTFQLLAGVRFPWN